MNEEYIRELLRSQRERQNEALNRQQQLASPNANLQQLGQRVGLGPSSTPSVAAMLSRARSPSIDASAASTAGHSALDLLTSRRRASDTISSVAHASPFNSVLLPSVASARAAAAAAAAADLSSLANSQEIKRLQELQQQMTSNTAPTTLNPFLYSSQRAQPSSSHAVDPNSAILQQYLMQRAQMPQLPRLTPASSTLSTSLAGNAGLSQVAHDAAHQAVLESQLLQEARMLMRRQSMPTTFATAAAAKAPAPFVQSPPQAHMDGSRKMRGGVIEPFPEKLHRLLLEVELSGRSDVISFVSEGRAFTIHNSEVFFREIVPLYFRQSRLSSFKRQLNLYGFELVNTGPSRGAYYHDLFQREHPELCRKMRRVAVKVSSAKKPAASSEALHASQDEDAKPEANSSSSSEGASAKQAAFSEAHQAGNEDGSSSSEGMGTESKVAEVGGAPKDGDEDDT